MLQNVSSAAVVIGTLRAKGKSPCIFVDFTIRMNAIHYMYILYYFHKSKHIPFDNTT